MYQYGLAYTLFLRWPWHKEREVIRASISKARILSLRLPIYEMGINNGHIYLRRLQVFYKTPGHSRVPCNLYNSHRYLFVYRYSRYLPFQLPGVQTIQLPYLAIFIH